MHTAQADSYDKDSDPRYIRVVPTDSYGRINFANEGSASRDEGEAYLSHFNEKNSFCRSPSNFLRTLATRLCELRRLESAKKHAHSPTVPDERSESDNDEYQCPRRPSERPP